ncbi:MAG: peptide chain release factor N(5)-glutamine methyltransferase [Spirochaetes bacterium]|nr:peptide chain release factor N(5)-glutamine methyltransferase [Spirochaetota bacterium]
MKLIEFLADASSRLEKKGITSSRLDAEVITARTLGIERYRLITDSNRELSGKEITDLEKLICRRLEFEPVAYITGVKEFYAIEFIVTKDVLIPRPETELLVDMAIYWAPMHGAVLDLCAGSGAIAVALKKSRPDLALTAADISGLALEIAKENSEKILGHEKITFLHGDLFSPVKGKVFDLIVSNPPYVDIELKGTLQKELEYEPANALYCEDGGRGVIARIIEGAGVHLADDGVLLLEIGSDQRAFVEEHGAAHGYSVSILNDYAGFPRVATLKKN